MDKVEVEKLIKEQISEAKLEVSEKRLQTVTWVAGGFLALFGVIVPLWFTSRSSEQVDAAIAEMKRDFKESSNLSSENINKSNEAIRTDFKLFSEKEANETKASTDKVDKAISDMQNQFKELAGVQLRKPILECLLAGRSLEGSVIQFPPTMSIQLELRNSGDAPARNIRIRVYLFYDQQLELNSDEIQWQQLNFSDEPTYNKVYETYQPFVSLDSKESRPLVVTLNGQSLQGKNFPALLKIYYEQPEPKKYTFTINIQK